MVDAKKPAGKAPNPSKRKNRRVAPANKLYDGAKAKRKSCPKCGPGVFMGEHKNRTACGRCGYTEFKK